MPGHPAKPGSGLLATRNEGAPERILDVRPEEDFLRGHLRGAYNVPWAEIASRGFELPTRSTPLTVCCAESEFAEIQEWFTSRHKPWNATVVAIDGEGELPEMGRSTPGHFLFSASPLMQDSDELLDTLRDSMEVPKALDVGCGSGREAIWLATRGWEVFALDRDARGLERLANLAQRQGCPERCRTLCCTLESTGDLLAAIDRESQDSFQLVMVNRHLHRATLKEMVQLLAPGGLLLFHTFMEGCSHPKDPEHLLRPGELRATFAELEVLRDEEMPGEDGRVMSFFVGRKT